jgi:hypothetical protein
MKLRMVSATGAPLSEVTVPLVRNGSHLKLASVRYINGQLLVSAPKAATTGGAAR